ncbi:MAG: hypothetical protein JW986_08885 [Methanotrichaceae archaeon]|nr:hypothetical protein [Methanotrichaceae archaeon]
MELAYYYDLDSGPIMKRLLEEEFFKRIGPTVREAQAMGFDKPGFYMYIKARDDLAEEAQNLLKDSPAKPLLEAEAEDVMKAFRDEAESAEAGMGALFG